MSGALVLFPGALGDAVCFEPAAAWLAARGPLVVYARGGAAEVLELFPCRPGVRSLDGAEVAGLFGPLADGEPVVAPAWLRGFGRVVSFTGASSAEVRARLARLPGAAWAPFPTARGDGHASDVFLRAVSGDPGAVAPPPRLALRAATGPSGGAPLLALHPGSGGPAKRAAAALFEAVARRWLDRGGAAVVLLGPAEVDEAAAWRARGLRVELPPTVADLAARLAGATRYLGNDSGPTHVAAALGVAGVALFTAGAPARFAPRAPRIRVVWLERDAAASGDADAVWSALEAPLP